MAIQIPEKVTIEFTKNEILALEEFLFDIVKDRTHEGDFWKKLHYKIYLAVFGK